MGRYASSAFRRERGASARKNTPVFENFSLSWDVRLSWVWEKAGVEKVKHAARTAAQTRKYE
jgi:hypothetical protein